MWCVSSKVLAPTGALYIIMCRNFKSVFSQNIFSQIVFHKVHFSPVYFYKQYFFLIVFYQKCIFAKRTCLACRLSFVSLFSLGLLLKCLNIENLGQVRLGQVYLGRPRYTRTYQVKPNQGFPYFNFLRGGPVKKVPCKYRVFFSLGLPLKS